MAGDLATAHPGEARLRAALAAAASGPVAPAWDVIRDRVVEGDAPVTPVRVAAPGHRGRWAALAAAAVVLVVALAGVVVATRPGDRSSFTATGGGTGTDTGWFLPRDLPLGWRVTHVVARRSVDQRCPGPEGEPARGARWEGPDADAPWDRWTVLVTADPCDDSDADLGPPGEPSDVRADDVADVALGAYAGTVAGLADGSQTFTWTDDAGLRWEISTQGLAVEETTDLAAQVATAGSLDAPVLRRLGAPTDRWTSPRNPAVVEVGVVAPDGDELAYELTDPGAGIFRTELVALPETIAGVPARRLSRGSGSWSAQLGLALPGTDVTVWTRVRADDPPDGEDLRRRLAETLATALAPVSNDVWRSTIAEVEHAPVLDQAERRTDLAGLDVPPRPQLPPPAGSTSSTSAPR